MKGSFLLVHLYRPPVILPPMRMSLDVVSAVSRFCNSDWIKAGIIYCKLFIIYCVMDPKNLSLSPDGLSLVVEP